MIEISSAAGIPIPVVRRLSHYLRFSQIQIARGREWIPSLELADALEVTSSTVRQDLSWIAAKGVAKRGYRLKDLVDSIRETLGLDKAGTMVIVGAGHLGQALAAQDQFTREGYIVVGLFDSNPDRVGQEVGSLSVRPISELKDVVQKNDVEVGVISVSTGAAQEAANMLVKAGIKGILNLTAEYVRTPPEIPTVEARISACLTLLSYLSSAERPPSGNSR